MRFFLVASSLTLAISCVLGSGCASSPDDTGEVAEELSSGGAILDVEGNHLTRNGKRWVPKGFSMIGALTHGSAVIASQHWGDAELKAAKSWGADALRLQVSEPALAERSSSYLRRVKSMVKLAEKHGFALILSMQDQKLSGGDSERMPMPSTLRAWRVLAPEFANDRNVIFELFNEPHNDADDVGWAKWKDGSATSIGHQELLDALRSAGAKNVVLVDGARFAQTLRGVPRLSDPLERLGYAVHPYFVDAIDADPKAWDERFGDLSAHLPVVATEWNDTTWFQPDGCEPDAPKRAPELVAYLGRHGIGIFGWAFDLPGTLVKDWSWEPTTLAGFTCGKSRPHDGVGELLKRTFSAK